MNRSHRTLWNETLHSFVAVPETASARGCLSTGGVVGAASHRTTALHAVAAAAALACCALAQAGPSGGTVSAGSGSISSTGAPGTSTTTITQNSPRLAVNWQSFNTSAGETVNFLQPGPSAVALNRVLGTEGTQFLGRLNANGQVFVINPNGVLFGKTAQVNVGGLVASTLALSDTDFMAGRLRFSGFSSLNGLVSNEGQITAADGGYVALLGGQVNNNGSINARLGSVALAAGNAVTLDFAGDGLLSVAVDQGALNALAANSGQISADGGSALLTAKAAGDLIGTVVNNTGVIQAHTLQNKAGVIKLLGDFSGGTVQVAGTLDARAPNGGDGGFVDTSGARVLTADGTRVTTLAAAGKTGTWLIDPNDYTVGAGGSISGATLSSNLGGGNISLQSSGGNSAGSGNVNINEAVSWSANQLTLTAANHVNINAVMNVLGTAVLNLNPATANGPDAAVAGGTVNVAMGTGKVNVQNQLGLSINGRSPFIVRTAAELSAVSPGPDYALGADVDASSLTAFVPIGNPTSRFNGLLEGLGHTISNLSINRPTSDYVGLIGVLGGTGTVRNLNLGHVSINGDGWVGGAVGLARNGTAVQRVSVDGSVSGNSLVGGVIGVLEGSLSQGVNAASVTVRGNVAGGVVGSVATTGRLSNTYNTGAVSGQGAVGGLVGNLSGLLETSFNTGEVRASGGGANQNFGGLVGQTGNQTATLRDAYSTGNVVGGSAAGVGGAIGALEPQTVMNRIYSSGAVSSSRGVAGGLVGGLVAGGTPTYTDSFWDTTTSGQARSVVGVGKTTDELKTLSTFTGAGWAKIDAAGSTGNTWRIHEGNTRPLLRGFLEPLTISAPAATVPYNGSAQGPASPTLPAGTDRNLLSNLDFNATDAGSYSGTAYSSQLGYDITDTRTLTITPKVLSTVQLSSPSKVYDGNNAASVTYSADVLARDDVSITGTARFNNKNVGNGKPVTATGLALVGTGAGNYTLTATSASTTGSITQASISAVSGITANNKTYDSSNASTLNTGSASFGGKIGNDVLTVASATGVFNNKNVGTGKPVSISAITLGGADAGNYTLTSTTATTTANITKASISAVTGITANNKTYDGNNNASLNTGSAGFTGRLGTDELTVTTATGTFSDSNAGSGKTVAISGISLGGTDASNYTLTSSTASTTADINKASITAVTGITANNKTYDGNTAASLNTGSAGFSGRIGNDVLTVATATGVFSDKNAGSGKTVAISGISLGGAAAGNYTLTSSTAITTADIGKASITAVTGITANNKTYDGNNNASLNTGSAAFSGRIGNDALSVATATGTFSDKNAGNGKTVAISGISLGGVDAGNYTLTSSTASATADIGKASITAVTGITANNKTYDGNPTATLNTGAVAFTGRIGNDALTLATATGAFSDKNAGNNKPVAISGISLGGADVGNYTLASNTASTSANITPRALAITSATALDKTYDGTTAAASLNTSNASAFGVLPGDTVTVTVGSVSFLDKNAGTAKPVTASGISLSGPDAGNYSAPANAVVALATILPKPAQALGLTVPDKTYDGTIFSTVNTNGFTLGGLVPGDTVFLSSAASRFQDKNAGNAKLVTFSNVVLVGADAGNYSLQPVASTTASILPRSLTISGLVANSKPYDGNTSASFTTRGVSLGGVLGADNVALGLLSGNFATATVGYGKAVNLTAVPLVGTDAGNYRVLQWPLDLKANITTSALCLRERLKCLGQ